MLISQRHLSFLCKSNLQRPLTHPPTHPPTHPTTPTECADSVLLTCLKPHVPHIPCRVSSPAGCGTQRPSAAERPAGPHLPADSAPALVRGGPPGAARGHPQEQGAGGVPDLRRGCGRRHQEHTVRRHHTSRIAAASSISVRPAFSVRLGKTVEKSQLMCQAFEARFRRYFRHARQPELNV